MNDTIFVVLFYLIPIIIITGIGVGVFFISRRILRKQIKSVSTRKILIWLATIILTPILFVGLAWIVVFVWTYYPNKDFNQNDWQANQYKRYEYSASIIDSRILVGRSKRQVRELLGPGEYNADPDTFKYDLGDQPDIFGIDEPFLFVYFENGKVARVEKQWDN
jgi:hypothetical protein